MGSVPSCQEISKPNIEYTQPFDFRPCEEVMFCMPRFVFTCSAAWYRYYVILSFWYKFFWCVRFRNSLHLFCIYFRWFRCCSQFYMTGSCTGSLLVRFWSAAPSMSLITSSVAVLFIPLFHPTESWIRFCIISTKFRCSIIMLPDGIRCLLLDICSAALSQCVRISSDPVLFHFSHAAQFQHGILFCTDPS